MASPLDLTATPERVRLAARAASLSGEALERAVTIAVATPSPFEWRRFLSRALALLGTCLLLAGAICFVAFNWDRIGRFGKFGLIGLGIVAAALVAWRRLPALSGQAALFAAAVLVGPLLALFGQTYQTGADPYGLFLTWSVLILPWAVAARFSALWLLVVLLLDVAALLFAAEILAFETEMLWMVLACATLHVVAVAIWEWQARRPAPWLDEVWAVRVAGVVGLGFVWFVATVMAFDTERAGLAGLFGVVGLAAAIIGTLRYHRIVRRDYFMVTATVVAGMAWITALLGRILLGELELDILGLLVLAAFVVGEIAVGVKWYRRHAL